MLIVKKEINNMTIFRISCFLTAISIGLNALGYHALSHTLSTSQLAIFETASRYLLFGSLWLLALSRPQEALSRRPIYVIMAGLFLFCGSLFLYLVIPVKGLMMVTPVGGVLMMGGFVFLGVRER
jgi:uncharacterized membrane protein YgdD (TMEM256/DUF423 family)